MCSNWEFSNAPFLTRTHGSQHHPFQIFLQFSHIFLRFLTSEKKADCQQGRRRQKVLKITPAVLNYLKLRVLQGRFKIFF